VIFVDNIVFSVFQPDFQQAYVESSTTLCTDALGDDVV
jgi:hypothetical protein